MVKLLLGLDARAVAARRGRCAGGRDLPPAYDGTCAGAARPKSPIPTTRGQRRRARAGASTVRPPRMIAYLRGRVLEKHPNRLIVDVQRRRLRRARAALDVLRRAASRAPRSRCASTRTCARTRCSSTGFATRARAADVRAADRRQRHRPEARAGGALGHRAARARRRDPARRRRAAHRAFPASARRPPSASCSS